MEPTFLDSFDKTIRKCHNLIGQIETLNTINTNQMNFPIPYEDTDETDTDFRWSLTFAECDNLQISDQVDHRDNGGLFVLSTVIDKKDDHKLHIHYDGWDKKWDTWCDYKSETHRFAAPGSISKKPNTLIKNLNINDAVRINYMHQGWKIGKIIKNDKHSGQVVVGYKENNKKIGHWVHLNNTSEISPYACWISGSDVPKEMVSECVFMLDETNIITVPPTWHWSTKSEGLYKYNILANEWSLHQKFPDGFYFGMKTKINCVAFDTKNKHLYMNKNDTEHDSDNVTWTNLKVTVFGVKNCQKSIVLNEEYHTFCVTDNKYSNIYAGFSREYKYDADLRHLLWNKQSNKFDEIHIFENMPLCGFGLIYVPKQQCLLLIGGDEKFKEYSTSSSIYSFSLKNKTWQKLKTKLPIPLYEFGCVISNDQNNVIIFGGSTTIGDNILDKNDIYVLNLETMCIKKSFITCPKSESIYKKWQAVITGNLQKVDILVTGFICSFMDNNYVPNDVCMVIKAYLNVESNYIHLFDGSNHWKIRIDDIMNFV